MFDVVSPLILFVGLLLMVGITVITRIINKKILVILKSLEQQEKDRVVARKQQTKCSKMSKSSRKPKSSRKSKDSWTKSSGKLQKPKRSSQVLEVKKVEKMPKSVDETKVELYQGVDIAVLIKQISPFLDSYSSHPEVYNVSPNVVPGFLYNALPSHPPEDPCSLEAVWKDYKNLVWPGFTHWQHPFFLAYFPCGRSSPDTMAEILISALSVPTTNWANCPSLAELEVSMGNWLGRALGLPEEMMFHGNTETSTGGGIMLESASEAIFFAVTTARTKKIDEVLKKEVHSKRHFHDDAVLRGNVEKHHEIAGKLVVYASTEAHSSIEKGCRMATVRMRQLKGDRNKDYAVTGEILEKAIQEDLSRGLIPCMLHVILGSTSSCTFDTLPEIGPVAKKYGMWIHVDSAFAGSIWVEPSFRDTQKGIELVDSIDINMHKALLHSNGMTMLWTRDLPAFRNTFGSRLETKEKQRGDDVTELFMHDSRRQKSLKPLFVLRSMGTEGLRQFIRNKVAMAEYLHGLMLDHPNVRMFGQLKRALFTFQYFEAGMSEKEINYHSECLHTLMNETGQVWITYSMVHGQGIIRVSVNYARVNKQDMDNLWKFMRQCIEQYREQRTQPGLLRFPPKSPVLKTAVASTPQSALESRNSNSG